MASFRDKRTDLMPLRVTIPSQLHKGHSADTDTPVPQLLLQQDIFLFILAFTGQVGTVHSYPHSSAGTSLSPSDPTTFLCNNSCPPPAIILAGAPCSEESEEGGAGCCLGIVGGGRAAPPSSAPQTTPGPGTEIPPLPP